MAATTATILWFKSLALVMSSSMSISSAITIIAIVFRMSFYFVISAVVAIAYNHLRVIATISWIPCPVIIEESIRPRLIHYDLVTRVQIIIPVTGRQRWRIDPSSSWHINKLVRGHIIIGFNIRQIIILHVVVTYRSPNWLRSDVDIDIESHLRISVFVNGRC